MFSLEGKVAVVTGSSGGIGSAIVKGYREAGAIAYGLDITEPFVGLDITDTKRAEKVFSIIAIGGEHIDTLVNCAGITFSEPTGTENYTDKDWDKTIATNLTAPWKLCKIVFPYMKNKGGSIINITSVGAEQGFSNNPAYGASKGGLKTLTKCLAMDWAKYGIRVNNIGPSYIRTNMTKRSYADPKMRKLRTDRLMIERYGEPEEVAGMAIYLASDASSFVTGQDFYIDAGFLNRGI